MSRKKQKPSGSAPARKPAPLPIPSGGDGFSPILAVALFAAALWVRLAALGRADLWCDEILFVSRAHAPKTPLRVLFTNWRELLLVTQLPLPELIENLFLWLCLPFDPDLIHNPALLRFPAALWGAGSTALVYRTASRLFRQPAALVAGLTLCFFFYPVYYSREVYYYAPLIFFAAAALDLYLERLIRPHVPRRSAVLFVLCLSGLVLSHLTGILMGALLFVATLGGLGARTLIHRDAEAARRFRGTLPLFAVPALLAAPYVLRLAANPIESGMQSAPMGFAHLLYYVLGKFTLGTVPPWPIIGLLVLLAGTIRMLRRGPCRQERVLLTILVAGALLILAALQLRTQFAVRYFNVLWPGLACLWAAGIEALAGGGARLARAKPGVESLLVYALGSVFILGHTLFFLPPLYQLRAKDRDFGGLARWLVSNLRPGTPYFFEYGGWDLRFIPGYFPTPGLSHTVALAWNGPDFEPAKRALQASVMDRFPESACIESIDAEWPELPRRFRRKAELRNEPLMQLIRRGAWFETPPDRAPDRAPRDLNIWYNTTEDAADIARQAGAAAFFVFTNTECAQMSKDVYVYAAQGARAAARVINLRGVPLRGTFRFEGAVNTKADTAALFVQWQGSVIAQASCARGQRWTIETPPVDLPPGEHSLTLQASARGGEPVINVAVLRAGFRPAP